tara:strand:+ start:219 stop:392 length:174 start_codon:yes stop_codon:yes gene_type:complete
MIKKQMSRKELREENDKMKKKLEEVMTFSKVLLERNRYLKYILNESEKNCPYFVKID